ncbi:MAG: DDE-type integrase/transposase/recombinase [Lachnospiraceae bacterium]|nr:DDE-type integrase/transposase/recombinase [Lachnospiraceae bacterium]MDY6360353.1 DDE-type integrase/transposase/recombinase [Lachnospiraceae bacterium]
MDQTKQQGIALMRYSAIAPLISGAEGDFETKRDYFRSVSVKGIRDADGAVRHYAPATIARWYWDYRKNGFEGITPSGRSDCGVSRKIDSELLEKIRYLKTAYPRLPASAIYRRLLDDGTVTKDQVSESTVLRCVNRIMLEEKFTNNQDMRRYERPHINEVWCGDSSVGPYLKTDDGKKHRVYVIALIDDASRFVVGADVFFNDNFVNLMSVIKSAVSKYGKPKVFNFDNGASYKNRQMELLAARIGSVISYCHPYSPTQKAKIERWFRTMKDHWMAALDMRDFHSLDELRGSLLAYVLKYNRSPHSSLKGNTPQNRFFSEPELIRRLPDDQIEKSFLLEVERKVSPDCVISIDEVLYEVDTRFAKRKITLRYSPDMKEIYVVETDGSLAPIRLLDKTANAAAKREKVHLSGGED